MYELMVEDTFDAAHALRGYNGPCENLHGHTWKVQLFISGKTLNKLGLLADFKSLKKDLRFVLAQLDHQNLNEVKPFRQLNPSCENIAKYIFVSLKGKLKTLKKVTVWESAVTCASFKR